ncbi:cellulose biosynthesis protein BcsC [Escherichia coli]|nr:cellulose biosynthesis protein BcsC [Escherichia coli]
MRKFTLNIFTLSLGVAVMPMVEAAPTAQQQLLEQVRLGEATHREDLVQQSLYRLELIDPNNPDVVAARFRSLLRQGDIDGAQKQLDRLSQLAPSSNAYKSSRTTMLLSTPDGRQALQQARLQATTGHAEEAVASYNKLFNGAPPEGDIAVEYWSTVAKIPARRGEAINQLKRINADAPGNTGLQNNLALLLFSSDRRDEGFAVLEQMAKSNAGREGASKIWYGQIKDMPVSDASVSALKKYLSIFSDGDSVAAAQSQLAEQQKQLADPAFRARAQGLAAVDSGMAGKAIPELQQAVRANPKDSEALGALGQAQLGDTAAAQRTFNKLIPQAKSQPPSMESAMVLRDGAKFEAQAGDPTQALETYKDAMVASGVTTTRPQDNDTFTRLTRNDEKDDWLKRGVRSDAADLYRQQDLNVTLEHDYWGSSGTGGYSDLKAHTTMLQVDAPYSDGRMFFRSDFVNMNVGSFSTNADGKWDDNWGTCTLQDCSGNRSQSDSGASVAVGWRNDVWSWDIGTTPMGFNVVDVVGGISYSDDIGPLGYTVNAHRRPISSSLLAFGGQKDSPSNTGKKWGGVRADGVGLSLSYDKGEANGVWASLSGDQLTGKNVEDNWRVRWMTGYYYKVINQNNRPVTIGLNNMIWHYDKDLSGYSLGQGGYYSPQEYLSFAIPVMWRERTENWSWELGASGSWSHSRTKTMPRYPLMNLIPTDWQEEAARQSNDGGSSQGFGYTARALLERRVTSNWFVGTAIDIQQAKDYAPSHFLLYVRYSAAGWQGDMDLPPQPLIPYADW